MDDNLVVMQLYSFFTYIISGIILGIFFDIFRILRKSFKTSDLVTYIEDIIFWICSGIFLQIVIFKFNDGVIRVYTIVGIISGVIIYMLTISRYFIKINVLIVTTIKKVISQAILIFFFPLKFLFKILKKIIFKPFSFLVINIKKKFVNIYTKLLKNNKIYKKITKKEGF